MEPSLLFSPFSFPFHAFKYHFLMNRVLGYLFQLSNTIYTIHEDKDCLLCVYSVVPSSFLILLLLFFLLSFPFTLKVWSQSLKTGLLMVNYLVFLYLRMFWFLFHFFRISFAGYGIYGWLFFYFSTLNVLFKFRLVFWICRLVFFDRFVNFSALISSTDPWAVLPLPHLFFFFFFKNF